MQPSSSSRPSVYLVDAFRDEREMYAEYLDASGFGVCTYANADAAFADAVRHAPDLVVSRLVHASRGPLGAKLTERLKAHKTTSNVPVVILTSMIGAEFRDAARASGADRYLLLPCLPEQLVAEARRLIADSRLVHHVLVNRRPEE